ncbi:MAG: IS200/IS605 family element transposase accessory protein TnpB [Symploca sp. SIO2E6]|nr:IS200/IS605 family element transposase accessory protein TnpB [Symploca sp. SIO2E6]
MKRLVAEQIGKLVIGKNEKWKQEINLGKVVNQNFVAIPHARLIEMITYKAQLVGIEVIVTVENYTSKTSFIDLEPVEKHKSYQGTRVNRGLFRSNNGTLINADINGAHYMIRKVFGNEVFNSGSIEAFAVAPVRMNPCQLSDNVSQCTLLS